MYGLVPTLAAGTAERAARPAQIRAAEDRGRGGAMDPRCLIDAVEFDVIPRLLDAYRSRDLWTGKPGAEPVSVAPSIEPLAEHLLAQRMDEANALVDSLRTRGASIESIYTGLLTGAAHDLGVRWEEDEASFADVTIGLCGLHQIMYRLSPDFRAERMSDHVRGRALLVPAPQETHFFGVLMAADFFARAGWQVWTEVECSADRLLTLIREEEFDLIGFSISCDKYLERTADVIGSLRARSSRSLNVIVGGRAVTEAPSESREIGADAAARDAAEGIRLAEAMLDKSGFGDRNTETVNFLSQK